MYPGPLGIKDMRFVAPIESLSCALNEQDSELAELWTDRNAIEWVETLGIECPEHTPGIVGVWMFSMCALLCYRQSRP